MPHSCAKQVALWVAVVVLMLAFLGRPPVQRTQEARVLETAREMLAVGGEQLLIPRMNGEVRLEKPPLAYWLSAIAFKVGGVNEFAGRVPIALAGFATLLLTFAAARSMWCARAGWIAVAALLGTMIFARHARLAETDILATLFVTAAIWCIWRDRFRISGVMIGLAMMSKGLPAVFVIAFLIALAAIEKDWRLIWRWARSGAPIFAIVIGAWWYVYIIWKIGWTIFIREAKAGVEGSTHAGSFVQYFPDLLKAVAPWCALTILAIVIAGFFWRGNRNVRTLFIWFAAVFVPLLVAGQRQFHYLLPAIPPLAMLTAWVIEEAIAGTSPHGRRVATLLILTCAALAIAGGAVPIIASHTRGSITPGDWAMGQFMIITALATIFLTIRSLRRGVLFFAAANAIAMTLIVQLWAPSLRPDNARAVAAEIRSLGGGSYCFLGKESSMTLVFYLRQIIPRAETIDDLAAVAAERPGLIVIAESNKRYTPPKPPPSFVHVHTIQSDEQTFEIYRAAHDDHISR